MKIHRQMLMLMIPVLLFSACTKETEEDKVKKVVMGVQKAAEEKKIGAVLEHISKTYRDPQGNDYNGIKGLLAFYFFRHQKVSVYMPNIDIAVAGPTAKAMFQTILTGRGTGEATSGILPEALGAYNFEVLLNKEDGAWKVTSAKWELAGEGTLLHKGINLSKAFVFVLDGGGCFFQLKYDPVAKKFFGALINGEA